MNGRERSGRDRIQSDSYLCVKPEAKANLPDLGTIASNAKGLPLNLPEAPGRLSIRSQAVTQTKWTTECEYESLQERWVKQ